MMRPNRLLALVDSIPTGLDRFLGFILVVVVLLYSYHKGRKGQRENQPKTPTSGFWVGRNEPLLVISAITVQHCSLLGLVGEIGARVWVIIHSSPPKLAPRLITGWLSFCNALSLRLLFDNILSLSAESGN